MKKVLLILLITCQLIFGCNYVFAQDSLIKVLLDNKQVQFDVQPFILNDRILVPFRAITEALGTKVEWDSVSETITATKTDEIIIIQIGNNTAKVNGKETQLDVPAMVKDGRTFVPLRFLSESLGADVTWNESSSTVLISSEPVNNGDSLFTRKMADKDFSLLDNRLFIKMPEGTKEVNTKNNIMGTKASNHEETRLMLELTNNQRLLVYSKEIFASSTGDLEKDAKIYCEQLGGIKEGDYKLSTIQSDNNLDRVIINIENPSSNGDPLIKGAIVRTADNELIFVGTYFNAAAYTSKEDCLTLAENVLKSLKVGTRTLDTSAHKETFGNMNMSMQKDYILITEPGIDFIVYYIIKIVPIDEVCPTIGIYLGAHPSFSVLRNGYEEADIKKISTTILGYQTQWLYYGKDLNIVDTNSYMQTLVNPGENSSIKMHIFINPTKEKNLTEMKQMAESLTYNK